VNPAETWSPVLPVTVQMPHVIRVELLFAGIATADPIAPPIHSPPAAPTPLRI
jgi:hypothetical protein